MPENKDIKIYKGYRMIYDLHTHTIYSHGKGTIRDNVLAALDRGLAKVAITDHGPGHLTYGIKKDAVPKMRLEIEELKKEFKEINICLGVEANIISRGSCLDVGPNEFWQYDFVLGGYHYGVLNGYCMNNFMEAHKKNYGQIESGSAKKLKIKNTEMAVRAIYENDLKILTHPGDKGPFDMIEIAKACAERGTLMEISTWHDHLTTDEIKLAALTDTGFIISSDAHHPSRIGDFEGGLDRAMEAGLDIDRIVNIERV